MYVVQFGVSCQPFANGSIAIQILFCSYFEIVWVETWPARIAVSRNTASSSTTSRSTNSTSTSTSISSSRRAVPAGEGGSRHIDEEKNDKDTKRCCIREIGEKTMWRQKGKERIVVEISCIIGLHIDSIANEYQWNARDYAYAEKQKEKERGWKEEKEEEEEEEKEEGRMEPLREISVYERFFDAI
ncbi:hypothetical protein V1478_003905 [Vespula squamosa]|uniref:Uncharacterized protein n=1 Tax=Vespula squamosa TaxID=30214 RepID=A0ABD2BN54_VESSQ